MHNAQLVTLPIGQHTMHSNSCAGKLQNEIIFLLYSLTFLYTETLAKRSLFRSVDL